MSGHAMARKILRAGYFWLTMENDCCVHVRKCHNCQPYADNINAAPVSLYVLTAPWSFSMWGMDVIGAIELKASIGQLVSVVGRDGLSQCINNAMA